MLWGISEMVHARAFKPLSLYSVLSITEKAHYCYTPHNKENTIDSGAI